MQTVAEQSEAQSPDHELWCLFRTLFRQHRRRFLIAASELDLHPAQAGALLQLDAPLSMNELAAVLGCDNSNVTGLIDRLETHGLAARQTSSHDRRVKNVVLTPRGERLREQLLDGVRQPAQAFRGLSRAEQRQLGDLLRRVVEADAPCAGAPRSRGRRVPSQ